MPSALHGLKVLDLSTLYAGAWCGRLLADFGAEVILRDPHPARDLAPFDGEGESIPARYVLANRRSVMLDQDDSGWTKLFAAADLVIDDAQAATPERAWVDALMADAPNAVHVVVTPHGLTGARAHWPGNEMTADAMSGWASVNGLADRSPLKASGFQASYQTGTVAFGAAICALIHRHTTGAGQQIDVAMTEVLSTTFAPGVLRSLFQDAPWPRHPAIDFTNGPAPVKDGYFSLTLTRPHFWAGAMKLLGLDDLADDTRLLATHSRPQHKDLFVTRVHEKMLHFNKADLFQQLSDIKVLGGPAFTMDELDHNENMAARGFFASADGIKYPGAPFKMSQTPFALNRGLPTPGADTAEILSQAQPATVKPVPPVQVKPATGKGPLAGYRGVVLTQAWSGTLATQLLGSMGAEIIQVEARTRFDSWRGTYETPMPIALRDRPSAEHPWNCNPLFNSVNLGKESVTLELSTPEGVEVFKQLVAEADFVAENFKPGVMKKLGVDYDALRAVKPDIIFCSISGYGQTGPWSPLPAIGGTIEPASGMSALLGYDGGTPMNSGQMYPDPVAALYGFSAIALALYHRERTGEGQAIDMAMQEANFTFVGDAWMEYATTGAVPGPRGNRHMTFAPHGIYPANGEDQWVAIAVETDAQWDVLCDIAGKPDWREKFSGNRKADEESLEAEIAAWTETQGRDALAQKLAEAGVIAAPVQNGIEVAEDPVYRERGAVVMIDHPETGAWPQTAIPCHLSRTPVRVHGPAPLKGVHSQDVLTRVLGMTAPEYDRLESAGITGVEQPPARTVRPDRPARKAN
jgi:crotonobetainyl-CoA:carnitine CoA-transferase CaiB-like acyl-CoA transferase